MNRRKFIELSAFSTVGALFLNGQKVNAFSKTDLLSALPSAITEGKTLVLVQLKGGNDGLNTLIPVEQIDDYARLRPTIKLKTSGTNAAIALDTTLAEKDKLLIHPSLTGLKALYDEGKLNIIHSVGYPFVNKSHFASRAMMFQGADGSPENSVKEDGWMARFLYGAYDYSEYQDPLGIQLGSQKPSLGFQSNHDHKVDINLSGQDVGGYYNVVSSVGNPSPEIPASDYGKALSHIANIESGINTYSERISEVFNSGLSKRNLESTIVYPDTNLSDQLKTVATLIRGGSKTKVYLVSLNGFDTHGNQVLSGTESHKGKHADLLQELGDALKAFQDDIKMLGVEDQVVSATFTEFGRKPAENGNLGTDHGNLGPMFVVGKNINPGITGENLNLKNIVDHYDENEMQYDYREVFTSLLTGHLGATDEVLLKTEFEDYKTDRLNLINNSTNEEEEEPVDPVEEESKKTRVFPTVTSSSVSVAYFSNSLFRGQVVLSDANGARVLKVPQDFYPRLNTFPIDLSHLSQGMYILVLYDGDGKKLHTQKVIKQ